tara:strand:- start:2275 stop:2655 length:381 start_codon:yes stop_codon:yes gene_type:complete
MPSWEPALNAMGAVNRELETHFENLSDPQFQVDTRETISLYEASGFARGCFAVALHQQFLSWQLEDLALAESLEGESPHARCRVNYQAELSALMTLTAEIHVVLETSALCVEFFLPRCHKRGRRYV